MSADILFYTVKSAPEHGIDGEALLRTIGRNPLVVRYDINEKRMLIGVEKATMGKLRFIERSISGLSFERFYDSKAKDVKFRSIACYNMQDKEHTNDPVRAIVNSVDSGTLMLVFVPARPDELKAAKEFLEKSLSDAEVRATHSNPKMNHLGVGVSLQRELFGRSEDRILFRAILTSVDNAILSGGLAYKIFFLIPENDPGVRNCIGNNILILKEFEGSKGNMSSAIAQLYSLKTFAFDPKYSGSLISLYGDYRSLQVIQTKHHRTDGGVAIGSLMSGSASITTEKVLIDKSSMNLGFMISGLPGSGKTSEAMAIIDNIIRIDATNTKDTKTNHIIISPTGEWRNFAAANKMSLVRLYDDECPINFFRCPDGVDRHKFYENLAMILASASNAGPYQNPMEKCMLNAFRRVYEASAEPDPVDVYNEIEASIVMFHAKKSPTGIKYTKHGENIRSGLENLRGVISRPEYCTTRAARIEDIIGSGAVFDISNASNATKPYLYALILNMVYAVASKLDVYGDNELRLLICLEESQIIFGDKYSAAVKDLRQRIQDFRKQGIGLMLIAHNANDIDAEIRRLCQLKLYLKQAPDVSLYAAKDMIFAKADEDEVALKLKSLDARIGAFSYLSKEGSEKISRESIFVRTIEYLPKVTTWSNPLKALLNASSAAPVHKIKCSLSVSVSESLSEKVQNLSIFRILFLGECIAEGNISNEIKAELLEGKTYLLQLLDKRAREVFKSYFVASKSVEIRAG